MREKFWRLFDEGPGDDVSWAMILTALAMIALFILCLNSAADAHDSWVSRGNYKNAAGEWCCGDYDCKSFSEFRETPQGWVIKREGKPDQFAKSPEEELLPFDAPENIDKVAPPDGGITVCRRPDGSRRCVFGLKPGG